MARPTTGVALLEKYKGDPQSIRRMQAVIETLAGRRSVVDACRELGIGEAMFRRFRDTCLQAGIAALDPRKVGRKPKPPEPGQEKIEALEQEQERLRRELIAAQTHLGLAQLAPSEGAKKNTRRKRRQV